MQYESNFITFFKLQNFRNGGQIIGCQELGAEAGVGWRKVGVVIKEQYEECEWH